jgi:hypothetical protein
MIKKQNEYVLNYKNNMDFINTINNKNDIKVMYFDFNNYARKLPNLINGNNFEFWSMEDNNYNILKNTIEKLLTFYNNPRNDLDKIFLINSWNEWGENMAIEPSNEINLYYLELINNSLKQIFDH